MKYKIIPITLAFTATDTVKDTKLYQVSNISVNRTLMAKVKIPDFSGTLTATFALLDPSGDEIFSKATLAKNTVHIITADTDNFDRLVEGNSTIRITLTAAAGSIGNVNIDLVLV